jgi:hypothetical protein
VTKLLLPPGLPSDWVSIEARSGDKLVQLEPGGNDIHRGTGLVPGPLSVEVFVRDPAHAGTSTGEPMVILSDLEVKPGVEVNDPRVNQIDLKQHMLWIQLHVTDPDGADVASGTVDVVEAGEGEPRRRSVPIQAGFARFATRKAAVDVHIHAPGFEPRLLEGIEQDADVKLVREK